MKPTIEFVIKNRCAYIQSNDPRQVEYVRSLFYNRETIYIKKRKGQRKREIKIFQITPSGKFNIGFFYAIYKKLKDTHLFKFSEEFKKTLKPDTFIDPSKYATFDGIEYNPYQIEAIQKMAIKGRGIVELGTSGGKSYICAGFSKTVQNQQPESKILIIVPGLSLVNQLYTDFIDKFKMEDVTIFTSTRMDEYDKTKKITITNSECLISQIKNDRFLNTLEVDYVIIDECHKINDNTIISSLLDRIETNKKFGLTATLPDTGVNYYNIIGKIGNVIYSKNAKALREENYIAQLKIIMMVLEYKNNPTYPKTLGDGLAICNFEKDWIIHNDKRNNFIKNIVKKFTNTSLILVDKIVYGEILLKMLKENGIKSVFIRGSTTIEDRVSIQKQMESYDDMIVIAMDKIFSTGLSINNIHNIIFAYIGKSKIKILQSIGRGLRKNHNKQHVMVFDLSDDLRCSSKHFAKRYELYQKEVDEIKLLKYRL